MKYLTVYDKDETNYTTSRLGFLQSAKDVCITQSINGDYTLNFSMPQGDEKWKLIAFDRKVGYDGKVFRIKMIDGYNVEAVSLMQDACRDHIQRIDDMINMPAYKIFEGIFKDNPYVKVLSEQEYTELGLEPVTDNMDFFEVSKKTAIGCLNLLMESLNKYKIHSEVYIDNNKIGLVRKIGRDRGVVIDPRYNGVQITPKIDSYLTVTKLFPYGKDDLPLTEDAYQMHEDGTVTVIPLSEEDRKRGKRGYILSPNYNELGSYEAFCNFDEIEDPEDLLEAAKFQFDKNNIERIDIPKYSVEIRLIDIKGEVKLGDTVTVNDVDNGIKIKHRVVTVKTYPFEPHRNTIVVGVPSITTKEVFDGMFSATQYLRINKNGVKDELKTSSIEFMKKNMDVTVENNNRFQKIAQYETGAMFVSPNGRYAVAIIDGKIKIGVKDNSKADGWDWIGVFGHGEGDAAAQTFLYTNLITIMSESGELKIENNLIQMFDSEGTLRFNAGYIASYDKYVFELYNTDGMRTAYMDDNGNLTICGIFKTGEDGANRVVIDGNGLTSYNSNNNKHGLEISGLFPGLKLYYGGDEAFEIRNNGLNSVDMYCAGERVIGLSDVRSILAGVWWYAGSEIANKNDINNLQKQINALKGGAQNLLGQ